MVEIALFIGILAVLSYIPKDIWKGLFALIVIGIVVSLIYFFFYWVLGYEEKDKYNTKMEYYTEFWKSNKYISDEIITGLNENKKSFFSYCEISKENNIESFSKKLKTHYYNRYSSIKDSIEYTYYTSSGQDELMIKLDRCYDGKVWIPKDDIDIFLKALDKLKEDEKAKEIVEEEKRLEKERINSLYEKSKNI